MPPATQTSEPDVLGSARPMGPASLVLLAAGLAGVATLAAEMLWIRGLGRGIGTTYEAVAMVAGLFLAGLGLGALLGARFAPSSARPARVSTWLMAGAGTWIALSPLYLAVLPDLRLALFAADDSGLLPALLLESPLVLPAALCLGAVFPFLVRARVADVAHAGSRTGAVYAANTAGAVAGVLLLLPLLAAAGETQALRLVGAVALLGAFLLMLADRPLPHGDGPPASVTPGQTLSAGGLAPALFLSGAAALLSQMAWLRMLQPLAGAHLHGLALLLAPLLLALALGAVLAGPLADRLRRPSLLVPALLAAAGALVLLSLPLAGSAPLRVITGESRVAALVWAFVLTVAPATIAFGALLPAAVRLRALWSGNTSGPAGRLYAWNALGALAGSLLAGYLLLPAFGAERTLFVAAVLVIATAIVLRWRVPGERRQLAALLHALPLLLLLWPGLLAGWLESGPTTAEIIAARKPLPQGVQLKDGDDLALFARWFGGRRAARPKDVSGAVLPAFEGRGGRLVLIEEPDGRLGLRRGVLRESVFDADAPNTPARTEYALGLLPALLHERPKRALVIGHGAGWTAEAVLAAGVEHLVVAEIDPAVLAAARAVRDLERLPVEQAGHADVLQADGRVLLRAAASADSDDERYDVIASQPSHPWSPVSSHLFTVDAYRSAKAALRPGGVHAQWLNLFDMTPALFHSALASFRSVFEYAWVFRFPDELVLLGFRAAPRVVPGRWELFFRADNPRADAARAAGFDDPGDLLKHLVLDAAGIARVLPGDVAVLEDDRPRLELELAARRLRAAPHEDAAADMIRGFPPDLKAVLPETGVRERWITDAVNGWLDDGASFEAGLWSRKLRWGFTADGHKARARAALAEGQPQHADTLLRAARTTAPERGDLAARWIDVQLALIGVGSREDHMRRAQEVQALVESMPDDGRVLAAAARFSDRMNLVEVAGKLFEQALAAKGHEVPGGARIHYARLLLSQAFEADQAKRARTLLAEDPETYTDVDTLDLLVRLTSAAGEERRALEIEKALATLQRTRGLALLRQSSSLLARHDLENALLVARRCTTVWTAEAEPWELHGLAALARSAQAQVSEAARAALLEEALDALQNAIQRSRDPAAARKRGQRMLSWFGRDPSALDARPDAGAQ